MCNTQTTQPATQTSTPGIRYRYVAGMDGHDIPRNVAHGELTLRPYIGGPDADGTVPDVITLDHVIGGDTSRPTRDAYVVDDGNSVRVFYVAAWRFGSDMGPDSVILHPMRPGGWHPGTFGTRRMVHVTITRAS